MGCIFFRRGIISDCVEFLGYYMGVAECSVDIFCEIVYSLPMFSSSKLSATNLPPISVSNKSTLSFFYLESWAVISQVFLQFQLH